MKKVKNELTIEEKKQKEAEIKELKKAAKKKAVEATIYGGITLLFGLLGFFVKNGMSNKEGR